MQLCVSQDDSPVNNKRRNLRQGTQPEACFIREKAKASEETTKKKKRESQFGHDPTKS